MSRSLCHVEGHAGPGDSKSVKLYPFDVPEGTRALAFHFDYGPRSSKEREKNRPLVEAALTKHNNTRTVQPTGAALEAQRLDLGLPNLVNELHNLMNAVLIDPAGRWRGRWDRNPASEEEALILTEHAASKGFLPGTLTPGRWTIAVECHGVFHQPITYQARIEAREPLSQEQVDALNSAPRGPVPAKRTGPGWYFGEMHSHTTHSDGRHELIDLTTRAAKLGLDFLCLTDHNTTSGLLEPEGLPVTLIPGCELTTFHGHHPIYGLTDIIPWHQGGRVLGMPELAPIIRAKGGIVSVAHPFKIGDPVCTGCRMPDGLDPQSFDLFEVWYRNWDAAESDNPAAHALWNRYWAQGRRITAVAARDWHGPSQELPFPGALAFTGVWAEDNSVEAILTGLRSGAVIMSGGPIATLELMRSDGKTARVGQTLKAHGAITLKLQLDKLEGQAELRLFRSGECVRKEAISGGGHFAFPNVADRPGWYRAEVWSGAEPRVLTNHVVVS